MANFTLGTLNITGGRDPVRRATVFDYLLQKNIKVAFFQETHSDEGNRADWFNEWQGEVILSQF